MNRRGVRYDSKAWERMGDKFTNNYEQGMLDFRKNIIDAVIERSFRIPPTLLEIACADGWFIEQLRAQGYMGIYTGIDITPSLIERAKKRMPYERFLVGDATDMDYSDNLCDFVLCAGILMHLDAWSDAVREACRVSSKYVMFSTYGTYSPEGTYRIDDPKNSFVNRYCTMEHLMGFVPAAFKLMEFKSFPRPTEYMFQFLYERKQ